MEDATGDEPRIEYGIASTEHPDIEPLGHGSLRRANAELADSSTAWPGVYLVQRHDRDPWQRVTAE